jgi:predicted DNA-binding transcriptional regulator AlpA
LKTAIDNFVDKISTIHSEDLLSAKELASCILMSEATLSRLRLKNHGPAYLRFADGSIKYLKKDIIDWIRGVYHATEDHKDPLLKKKDPE